MKKFIAIVLTVMLMASMTVTAQAATPKLNIKVPQISSIKIQPKIDEAVYENAVKSWMAEHPIQFNVSYTATTLGD